MREHPYRAPTKVVRPTSDVSRTQKEGVGSGRNNHRIGRRNVVRRIDESVREAIADGAQQIEEAGWIVNRRALAREFSVSPQTVARILDGPEARRGNVGAFEVDP